MILLAKFALLALGLFFGVNAVFPSRRHPRVDRETLRQQQTMDSEG